MTVLNSHTSESTMASVEVNASNNVKVIVRVRPPNDIELSEQRKNVIEIMNENILVFDPREQSSPFHGRRRHRDIRKRRQKDLKFAFDHVFGWTSSNVEVFEYSTRTVLDGLLGGYNCSVFAYGATGAGKTHTMLGKESNPGVIYHTMIHLYRHIAQLSSEKTCDVAVSYLEVYNEQIRDLLMPHGTLPIREDHKAGVIVPGLSLHKPSSAEELLHMLQFGNQNRTQHPTDANAESSRSHAVFQVFVRQRDRTANISAQVKVAKMCLVDLAGSERATLTKNRGVRFREGANINRSLLALGNVINSLADHKYKGHIPYRDSKLTRLLKDSLGGNCRTIMIAAVSPSELSYEDTYNTLKYADRAKNIQINMKKNVISVDFHVSQYKKIVEELRTEISELKGKLHQCDKPSINYAHSLCLPSNLQSLHEALQAAYSERRAVRDQQLCQEITMRDTQWRLYRKHKYLHRATQLQEEAQSESVQKLQGVIAGLQRKVEEQETQRQALQQQLCSNTHTLHTLHTEAAAEHNKSSLYSQVLENSIQRMALEVEVNDSQHYINHLRRLARAQEQETVASETLITALLQLVQRQHSQLQHQGALTPDITASYRSVCELVGQWGVSWAHSDADQQGFHINAIIDIPLITTNGVPHSARAALAATSGLGCVAKDPPVPAPTPASLPASGPPPPSLSHPTLTTTTTTPSTSAGRPSFGASGPTSGLLCLMKQGSVATTDVSCSSHHHPPPPPPPDSSSSGGGVPGRCSHSPVTTIHAGHTPNPKKLPHRTDWGCGPSTAFYTAADCVLPPGGDSGVGCVATTPGCPLPSPAPSLNETFSLDTANVMGVKRCVDTAVSTPAVVVKDSSRLCLPVVDSVLCVKHHNVAAVCTKGVIGENRNGSVQSHSRNPQRSPFSSTVPVTLSHPGRDTTLNGHTFTGAVMEDGQGVQEQGSECSVSPDNQENKGPHPRSSSSSSFSSSTSFFSSSSSFFSSSSSSSSSARRSINFDGSSSASTPVKEVKSYADAVRTPTPTRQPLRALDCNSPQFQASSLPGEEAQSSSSSVCAVSSQALDNMRRLRQLGLPSLLENLVNGGHKNGSGPEGSKAPRYMQATKATARRVRLQPMSKDDCFHPRRVPGTKSLAHSRSKSTSQLNKVGWKI